MITCPNCYKDLPNDSMFCTYCGKPLTVSKIKEEKKKKDDLKVNPRKNNWAILGIFLLLGSLVIFDFVIASITSALGGNVKIPFYISFVLYMISIVCGALSLYVDRKDRKAGYKPNGNKNYAFVCICISFFISLVNLTQVILK